MKEGQNRHPLTLTDLQQVTALSNAAISADGKYLLYVATRVDMDHNTYRDDINVMELSSGEITRSWEGASPKWSPVANEIAYEAPHNGDHYIWICEIDSDVKRPLARVYESYYFMGHLCLKNFEWSPDGTKIAYVSAAAEPPATAPVKVIDRLLYKTKGGRGRPAVTDNEYVHIWVVSVKEGVIQPVTDGSYNEHSLCWSPDSLQIAFVSNRSADPDNNQLHDLWSVALPTGHITRHTQHFGTVCQPVWSPNGNHIAFLGTTGQLSTNDSPAEDTQLYALAIADNAYQCLTRSLNRRVEQPAWHPQEAAIYFTAGNSGTTAIYKVAMATGVISTVAGNENHILEYHLPKNGHQITYIATHTTQLTEIFIHELVTGTSRQWTTNSSQLTERCLLQEATAFWCESVDGTAVQGWLIKPALFDHARQYPLVLVIHGGPHNMFGYEFEDRMQLLSANGYGVLFINPRGSSGYGQAFSNGNLSDWGGGDYDDLMAGVDAAIRHNSWIDATRLGVTGQSYGGYMSNRIITKTTRFKAAVVDGGISNLVSFAGTSLYSSLMESEFGGSAYDHFAVLWNCSPLKDVKAVTTPTLFLHGETDNEVPLSQAEEMYTALKKLGVDSQFIQYTGEGHGWRPDLAPLNRYDLLTRTIAWFDKYLKS